MFLEELQLINFKNYSNSSFSFSPGLNFIYGENGNGKTNILEAISVLCYSRSFLLNSDSDCVKYGENRFDISGNFLNSSGTKSRVKVSYDKEAFIKELYYGSEKVSRLNEFIGSFPLVVLSPYDMKLTSGTPQDRRRNFDLLISQVSRVYMSDLRDYNKIIKQKNSLLRENLVRKKYSQAELKEMVCVWNSELLEPAVKIIFRRLDFIEEFRKYVEECFKQIVGARYIPVISYQSDVFEGLQSGKFDAGDIRNRLSLLLESRLDAEIKRGIALAGPHRDNYIFSMNKEGELFEMRAFASQGEHKTFIVSLKLSEFGYIKDNLQHTNIGEPLLLLDDVFSELDKTRISKISALITNFNQVFLTTTDLDHLDVLKQNFVETKTFQIVNGTASA
jgi:DNA replication and repair protein RecF